MWPQRSLLTHYFFCLATRRVIATIQVAILVAATTVAAALAILFFVVLVPAAADLAALLETKPVEATTAAGNRAPSHDDAHRHGGHDDQHEGQYNEECAHDVFLFYLSVSLTVTANQALWSTDKA